MRAMRAMRVVACCFLALRRSGPTNRRPRSRLISPSCVVENGAQQPRRHHRRDAYGAAACAKAARAVPVGPVHAKQPRESGMAGGVHLRRCGASRLTRRSRDAIFLSVLEDGLSASRVLVKLVRPATFSSQMREDIIPVGWT